MKKQINGQLEEVGRSHHFSVNNGEHVNMLAHHLGWSDAITLSLKREDAVKLIAQLQTLVASKEGRVEIAFVGELHTTREEDLPTTD